MKFIAVIALAFLLPMGGVEAQSVRVGLGIRIGLPSVRVVVPRRSPRVRVHRRRGASVVRVLRPAPRGHWVLRQYRHWVPAVYAYDRDACGRRYRYLVKAGHYEIREKRVWVPAKRPIHRVQAPPRPAPRADPRPGRRTRVGVLYS